MYIISQETKVSANTNRPFSTTATPHETQSSVFFRTLLQKPTCFCRSGGVLSKHWQLRRLWDLNGTRRCRSPRHHAAPLTAPGQPDQPVVRGGRAGGTCRKQTRGTIGFCILVHPNTSFVHSESHGEIHTAE